MSSGLQPPRPPALNHGVTSAVWGVALGAFVWVGLLSVDIMSRISSLVLGIVSGIAIFFFVLLFGDERPRRRQAGAKASRRAR